VKLRAEGIDSAEGKQKIVVELYDKFFRNAFPKMSERLGIVYTPVEVVDFILHSVDTCCAPSSGRRWAARACTSRPVHRHRHVHHAAAAERADRTRSCRTSTRTRSTPTRSCCWRTTSRPSTSRPCTTASWAATYTPFEGICLTDTFQMYEKDDLVSRCWWTTARGGCGRRSWIFG
jgi:hypothetical protein